jgi:hypothetical protein
MTKMLKRSHQQEADAMCMAILHMECLLQDSWILAGEVMSVVGNITITSCVACVCLRRMEHRQCAKRR